MILKFESQKYDQQLTKLKNDLTGVSSSFSQLWNTPPVPLCSYGAQS